MSVELLGYRFSVYSWIARLVLHEKGVAYSWTEIDPFRDDVPARYLELHPFKRVPALVHDGFVVYETGALARYVDEGFPGPRLQPTDARARARVSQIVSIIDSYGYWPLVRQVFSHGVFRTRLGRPADEAEVRAGLEASARVLGALDGLAGGGDFLVGDAVTLADLHLAPMTAYFAMTSEGDALLRRHAALARWWNHMARRPAVIATTPELPEPPR